MKQDPAISTIRKYNKASRKYDRLEFPTQALLFGRLRKAILPFLSGDILEVGVGTGKNLPYDATTVNLKTIDFRPGMLQKAQEKLKGTRVPNPVKGLNELKSVLKPGGKRVSLTAE